MRFLLVIAIINFLSINSFAQKTIAIQSKKIQEFTVSNIQTYSRYEDPLTSDVSCGYFNSEDGCFYDCFGKLISKVKIQDIKDGKGCCQSKQIAINFDSMNHKSQTISVVFLAKKDSTYHFIAKDSTKYSIQISNFDQALTKNKKYVLEVNDPMPKANIPVYHK